MSGGCGAGLKKDRYPTTLSAEIPPQRHLKGACEIFCVKLGGNGPFCPSFAPVALYVGTGITPPPLSPPPSQAMSNVPLTNVPHQHRQ
jgi:hypothetical protein